MNRMARTYLINMLCMAFIALFNLAIFAFASGRPINLFVGIFGTIMLPWYGVNLHREMHRDRR